MKENDTKSDRNLDREYLVEYAKLHLRDSMPYDDPNYEEKLQRMAEFYADYKIKEL